MLFAIILLPFAAGVLAPFLKNIHRKKLLRVLLALQLAESVLVGFAIFSGMTYATNIWYLTESLTIALKLDGVARVFVGLTAVAWLLTLLYASEYMKHQTHEPRFYAFLMLSEAALMATSVSADFVSMYIFYELTSLLSMPLVLHDLSRSAITDAMKYLYYSIGGAFFVLFGIAVLHENTSTLDFAIGGTLLADGNVPLVLLAVFFVVLGFGTKAGLFPMHNWLPSAHPVAPAPASALLSGIITKAGVIGIIRVLFFIAGPDAIRGTWVQTACVILALWTVFMGSMMAYREQNFKKRLAYSSISQISYVLTGLFLLTGAGMEGALLQIFFHAASKIGLFMVAGVIIYLTGCKQVEDCRGMGRQMPATFLCLIFLALSLVGIPPFGGFQSKWYLATAALQALPGALGYVAPAVLLLSALLTAGYLFRPIAIAFFPGTDAPAAERIREPLAMTVPLVILSAVCLLLGLFPDPMVNAMERISSMCVL